MSTELEELDLVSAIWILASNDENHLITHEGIRERLGLPPQYDVRALVMRRRELFRPGAPPGELEEWKSEMTSGRRRPRWIRQLDGVDAKQEAIDRLADDDVFRSQFRVGRDAPPSPIELVTWGLEHLDRLRKGQLAYREATAKSWQMWLVFAVGVANILVSVALALSK